jgi:hypothetical protein
LLRFHKNHQTVLASAGLLKKKIAGGKIVNHYDSPLNGKERYSLPVLKQFARMRAR